MSYISRYRGRRPRVSQKALGGFDLLDALSVINPVALIVNLQERIGESAWDATVDKLTENVTADCIAAADEHTQPLQDRIVDIHKNWNPTGFFSPDDIRSIVNGTAAVAIEAMGQIGDAPRSTSDADSTIAQVQASIQRRLNDGNKFLQTASDASFKNIPVEAQGLKDWVLSTMRAALQGVTAAYFFECSQTWLERVLEAVKRVLDIAWNTIKGIAGLAVAIGEEVAKVPDFLSSVITIAKYAALGYGIYWAFGKLKEHQRRGG